MSETFVNRPGVVDAVEAKRKGKDVKYLAAKIRFETEFDGTYYSEEKKVDEVNVSFAPDSGVNPGDIVIMTLDVRSPFGQRFALALEASTTNDELHVDVESADALDDDDEDRTEVVIDLDQGDE